MTDQKIRKQIRLLIILFMIALTASGISAIPLEAELKWLSNHATLFPDIVDDWIVQVYAGIRNTNAQYPFIAYGTDWLAFAHVVIALLFIGPLRDPVKNKWVIEWAMLCCVLIIPVVLVAGAARSIPAFHQLVDCSFGIIGIIPLAVVRNRIGQLEKTN